VKRHAVAMLCAVWVMCVSTCFADDLVVSGGSMVIDSDTVVDGSVFVENGGTLTIRNCTLTLELDYDEEHHVDVAGGSRLVIENSTITSTGGQFWFELYAEGGSSPTLEVSGASTWLTNHSGIRPFDETRIVITGGDVEELQLRDRVTVEMTTAAAYMVFFFDARTSVIDGLDTGTGLTKTIDVPGGWSFEMTDSHVEGYQIDLKNGADVTVKNGDGIVLSLHTPGNLGSTQRVVEGLTSEDPISGSSTNLGSSFTFVDCNIALVNVYVFGQDRVLLRDLHVNEVNAEDRSELVIGQEGYETVLNCNLCQVYDHATFTVAHATIDASQNIPSATSSYHDIADWGYGVMTLREMDLRQLYLTVRENGTLNLHNCQYDETKLSVLGGAATFNEYQLAVDFSASPLTGPAPLQVSFTDLSSGQVVSRAWSFGDGGTSSDVNPQHVFQDEGTYTVSLTATGPAGQNRVTRSDYIAVEDSSSAVCGGAPSYLAAAAHVGGAENTAWRTNLSVFNPGTSAVTLALKLLISDQDNSAAACVGAGTVEPGASVSLDDLVSSVFGVNPGVGGVAVYSGGREIVATSRTYNQVTAGTYGQAIPARTTADAATDGEVANLIQLYQNTAYRTNIGLLNLGGEAVTARIDLYDSDGTLLGTRSFNLPPFGHHQENRIFTSVTALKVGNGRAEVRFTGGAGIAYASVVDNRTGDPTFVEMR